MAGGATSFGKGCFGVLATMVVSGAASQAPAFSSSIAEPLAAQRLEAVRSVPLPVPVPGPSEAVPAAPAPTWTVFRGTSKADNSKSVQLQLAAETPIRGLLMEATPTLVVRCEDHKSEVFIVTEMVANPEVGREGVKTVTLRFDKDPAVQYAAMESTDQKAFFLRNAIDLAKTMARHRRMLFRFVPYLSPPQETVFDLTALEQSLPEVEATCAWK